jgi:hypothetical protein
MLAEGGISCVERACLPPEIPACAGMTGEIKGVIAAALMPKA